MKHVATMRPIVLEGTEAARAVDAAKRRSLKNRRAIEACKRANAKPLVVVEKGES